MNQNLSKNFAKYVSLNVLGMIGLSCYILVDTFFISLALGSLGIAGLNISISIYSIINGLGLMIGLGGASRFTIFRTKKDTAAANRIYSLALTTGLAIGLLIALIGLFYSSPIASLLGADEFTLSYANTYLKVVMLFAPIFITNNILLAFVRNDYAPRLSMAGMLLGSAVNILFDYILMFPLKMGMFGAALATGLAHTGSLILMSTHFIRKKNNFHFTRFKLQLKKIKDIFNLGLSAFISEFSSAIVLITFNLIIVRIAGNTALASYGIVANLSLVGIAIFTGISQGIQPLVSYAHAAKDRYSLKRILKYAILTAITIGIFIYLFIFIFSNGIVSIFNSEGNLEVASIAVKGLRIYFIGLIFAGINIITASILSASERPKQALLVSTTRGILFILPFAFILSALLHMTGVWLSFVLTEVLVTIIAIFTLREIHLTPVQTLVLDTKQE